MTAVFQVQPDTKLSFPPISIDIPAMTIFKKRHSQPQISPLEPPPAATTDNRRMSMQQAPNGRPVQPGQGYPISDGYDNSPGGHGPGHGSFRGAYPVPERGDFHPGDPRQQQPPQQYSQQHQQPYRVAQQSPELIAGPQYGTGSPVERVLSQRSRAGSEKSEKRKSGFFGFGRKDKDKDKDRKEEERRESLQPVHEAPVSELD